MKTKFFVIVAGLYITASVGCQQPENNNSEQHIDPAIVNNPATADPNATEAQKVQPILEFETTRHHFGVIQAGEKVSYTFSFKNTGNAPLIISNANASCGCTVPSYTKEPVEAGEEGSIEVTFDSSGKSGMESKNITIIANTIPNSTILTISAEIINEEK